MGVTSTALMLGNLLGPLVGGAVAGAWGLRPVFFVSAAAFFAILLFLVPRIEDPRPAAP